MIVLDASALVDVVADQPAKSEILGHLRQAVHAPGHQLAEVASALVRLQRADVLSKRQALAALQEAAELEQTVTGLDKALLSRAFALNDSIRILDGLYVALAERLDCPLLTTDARLSRARLPCRVILAQ
ncbi:MAG: PIN domain-containing protein [Nocardioidaceae bacterium]